ncbi:MAG: hypothetical protein U9O89_01705, partial [Thermoproteota archaeon]|nr:hypothetical protein [Thermoproteota archaeon]
MGSDLRKTLNPLLEHFFGADVQMGMTNETFTPHPNLKMLYYTYLAIVVTIGFLSWIVPVTAAAFLFLNSIVALIVAIS